MDPSKELWTLGKNPFGVNGLISSHFFLISDLIVELPKYHNIDKFLSTPFTELLGACKSRGRTDITKMSQ